MSNKIKGFIPIKATSINELYLKNMGMIMTGKSILPKSPRKAQAPRTKPNKKTESELSKRIEKDCDILELTGHVVHHDRYNCGKAMRGGYWIRLCKEGTSDRVIYCKNKLTIFIETKGGGSQNEKQKVFELKMLHCGHVYFLVKTWEEWLKIKEVIYANAK